MTATIDSAPRRRRGRPSRRDVILSAALDLFIRKGYQATSIDEIGVAAGVSGPAIYCHFGGKQDLLAAVFAYTIDSTISRVDDLLGQTQSPSERLKLLIGATVRQAIDERSLLTLYLREVDQLPAPERSLVRRKYRQLLDQWVQVLCDGRPGLAVPEARMVALSLVNMIGILGVTDGGISRARLEELFVDMSTGALEAAASPSGRKASAADATVGQWRRR